MSVIRTTPPRPLDVATALPALGSLARPALRLHPRPGSPSPHDSSVGGPLLWPAEHPWPYCDKWHEGPVSPLLPVAQLYVRDVPLLRPPGRADLLQVLWCPFEHPPEYKPPTELFWRTAAEVTHVLATPPAPSEVEYGYMPEPCVLAPEQITEYPDFLELSEQLRQQLADRSTWQAAGAVVDDSYAMAWEEFYINELSIAPGWKVGGWPRWGLTDPIARFCVDCGAAMSPLLTIASNEWDASTASSWAPHEDRAIAALGHASVANPPKVQVSRGNQLQLYVCSKVPYHSHTDLIQ
ncbi:hypothetical protein [Nocardia cyriacigeorgica]|uniref:hypothetical protein n=1 Tax=Nocardia cyriacigeorgica TaxID=135487 RepID=UPI002455E252|nr:hypothetical protein [Nocardia cyriacigeorgica]